MYITLHVKPEPEHHVNLQMLKTQPEPEFPKIEPNTIKTPKLKTEPIHL